MLQHRKGSSIQRASLGEQATRQLRLMIRTGELSPGARLIETDLADMLGVSRGPVRDALRQLANERLVTISPSRGALVTVWGSDDLTALFDIRALLEIEAIRRAVSLAALDCARDLTALLSEWSRGVAANDRAKCADFDFDFHRTIWHHAGNMWLTESLEHLVQPCHTIFYLNTSENRDLLQNWSNHARARDIVAASEPDAAGELMREHMATSLAQALEFHNRAANDPHEDVIA